MFEDEEPNVQRNEPLIKLYELLCSLITSLTPEITSLTLRDGSGERLNGYIDELRNLTNDDKLNDFKLSIQTSARGGTPYVSGEAYVRQLNGIVNYLFKIDPVISYYCSGPPNPKFSRPGSSPTFNNQFQAQQHTQQTTHVQVEFTQTIITITEALTNIEREFPDESSKENKFAKALKKSLPLAKDTLGIVALVLKVASEVGINPHDALKLLGLG